jgi:hypothetical protein
MIRMTGALHPLHQHLKHQRRLQLVTALQLDDIDVSNVSFCYFSSCRAPAYSSYVVSLMLVLSFQKKLQRYLDIILNSDPEKGDRLKEGMHMSVCEVYVQEEVCSYVIQT